MGGRIIHSIIDSCQPARGAIIIPGLDRLVFMKNLGELENQLIHILPNMGRSLQIFDCLDEAFPRQPKKFSEFVQGRPCKTTY